MRNRLFVAILTLLLCAITARADKPIVIKDSEAIQYVGKEVAVYGQVVSVTTSPLGTAFINFGGEYPDNIRWVHCGRVPHGERSATHYDLRENHKHPWRTIRLREGKPEIEIVSADQIKVLNSQTDVEADSFEEAFPPARSRLKLMDPLHRGDR